MQRCIRYPCRPGRRLEAYHSAHHHQSKRPSRHRAFVLFPHLDEQLAGAQDEAGVGVAHAGGKLAKGAGVAGVRVSAKQNLAGLAVALLGQRDVAHACGAEASASQRYAVYKEVRTLCKVQRSA